MPHFEYGNNIECPGKLESIKVKITCNRKLTSPDAVGQLAVLLGLADSSVKKAIPELTKMQPGDMVTFIEPIDKKGKRHFDMIAKSANGSKLFHLRVVLNLNGFDVLRPKH